MDRHIDWGDDLSGMVEAWRQEEAQGRDSVRRTLLMWELLRVLFNTAVLYVTLWEWGWRSLFSADFGYWIMLLILNLYFSAGMLVELYALGFLGWRIGAGRVVVLAVQAVPLLWVANQSFHWW